MIEEEKKHYQYMMYEAKELVVVVHGDDFYIIKIRKRYNVKTLNQYFLKKKILTYMVDNDDD
jgi:hypothetical protein